MQFDTYFKAAEMNALKCELWLRLYGACRAMMLPMAVSIVCLLEDDCVPIPIISKLNDSDSFRAGVSLN